MSSALAGTLGLALRSERLATPRRIQRRSTLLRASIKSSPSSYAPPTVADTKVKFLQNYAKPINAIYTTIIQELLVLQHFMRYNVSYQYDKVFALGVVSVFNQILDGLDEERRNAIFNAYITALDESPETYRKDAEELAELAAACSSPSDLLPDANGLEIQKLLAKVAERVKAGEHYYTRFFAIGLFRLLELTDAKDPKALGGLVSAIGVSNDSVNKDLLMYKSILSKMMAAKDLMAEMMERERRKQAERETGKKQVVPEVASA